MIHHCYYLPTDSCLRWAGCPSHGVECHRPVRPAHWRCRWFFPFENGWCTGYWEASPRRCPLTHTALLFPANQADARQCPWCALGTDGLHWRERSQQSQYPLALHYTYRPFPAIMHAFLAAILFTLRWHRSAMPLPLGLYAHRCLSLIPHSSTKRLNSMLCHCPWGSLQAAPFRKIWTPIHGWHWRSPVLLTGAKSRTSSVRNLLVWGSAGCHNGLRPCPADPSAI